MNAIAGFSKDGTLLHWNWSQFLNFVRGTLIPVIMDVDTSDSVSIHNANALVHTVMILFHLTILHL